MTGTYLPEPSPAFDSSGNSLSDEITSPVAFEGVKFGTATNSVDPQTGQHVPAPTIEVSGTTLSGNLEAFGVSWNNQQFNQGSPKPGGSSPGNTTPVTGTYNPATGAYTLQWSSQVVGGPFNNFSAFWNLSGTFTPSGGASSSAPGTSGAGGVASSRTSSTSASSAAPSTRPAESSGTTTTTAPTTGTAGASTPQTKTVTKSRVVLSSRTISTHHAGWNTPNWVLALLAVVAGLGVAGLVWAEMIRREQKQGAGA